ncbi:NAD-dependent epimerase/dehydratase family protein [Testudinibacter sp. P80/BLE/0925]|uniref:NAD-dependent epimerase/dehydratase family protein n=1 Tax=Testudinibacter sp. TW-1 TaxID=3417757 RepID=UPI003D362273
MIIGRGMLAKAFNSYVSTEDVIIFASGVSNSNEENSSSFTRERELLRHTIRNNPASLIVYFSTCSIYDSTLQNSKYVLHKLLMELILQDECDRYLIFRLPQVAGRTKSPTIINFIYNKINNGEEFSVFSKSKRNIIDVDDVFKIVDYILKKIYL